MIAIVSCRHSPDDERIYHKQIKTLIEKGFFIRYYTRSYHALDLTGPSMVHININEKASVRTFIDKVFNELARFEDMTSIQIHETDLLPLLKKIKLRFSHIKTIYDIHENMEALYRTFSKRIKPLKEGLIFLRKYQESRYLKHVDQIVLANVPISNNPYMGLGIPVIIIENFPELKRLNLNLSSVKKNISIVYHGHLAPERGIKDLIGAIHHIKTVHSDVRLSLIGTFRTKEFKNKISNMIIELNLKDNINIIPQVPHDEVWMILQKHSIGVIPFRKTPLTEENTPTKLFEMMASGLEIVATDMPPIRNFVVDTIYWSKPGDSFSIGNAILNAFDQIDNSLNIPKNQSLIKQKYNWENRKEQYSSLFDLK